MAPPSVEPLSLYRPRDPRASGLWQVIDRHFPSFQQLYDERFAGRYGFWRPVIERSVAAFLKCGDLHEGFARVRCPDCRHEMFVAFSCKQRCACPSCHQKRALLTARHVAEEVCFPVAHRQVVLTIPKRLRLHARFDRKLLGKLAACAWRCLRAEVRRLLGRDDALPGMIVAIQTHGELLHWHPHIHALVTCGAFTPEGEFLEVPRTRQGAAAGGLAGRGVFALPGRGEDRRGGRREHARLAAQRLRRPSLAAPGRRRPCGHRAADAVHHPLPVEPLAAGPGDEDRAGDLPGGEGRLPGVSRSARRRAGGGDEAEFSGPLGGGVLGGVHAAHSAEGRAPDSLLRLVLEQVARHEAQGGGATGSASVASGGGRGAAATRPGRCSSSGCTRSIPWPVRSAAGR